MIEHFLPILGVLGTLFGSIASLGTLFVLITKARQFSRLALWFSSHVSLNHKIDDLTEELAEALKHLALADERANRLDASVQAGGYLHDEMDAITRKQAGNDAILAELVIYCKALMTYIATLSALLVSHQIVVPEAPQLPKQLRAEFVP